jgi:hypothetical protein
MYPTCDLEKRFGLSHATCDHEDLRSDHAREVATTLSYLSNDQAFFLPHVSQDTAAHRAWLLTPDINRQGNR